MGRMTIEAYEFGRIVVDGQTYESDLILLPERILGNWWRQEGHLLHAADLDAVLDAEPDLLIVGQGAYGRMRIDPEVVQTAQRAGFELIALSTGEAVIKYNSIPKARRVAAALHLTC